MGLYSERLIIGRIFASEIWGGGAYFRKAFYDYFFHYFLSLVVPSPGDDKNFANLASFDFRILLRHVKTSN